uniref:Uncharacterized protein n=1 Tax=Knipowitschia caucasica TaxID=637954 RepID=A0AAV2KF48_KNICA
MRRTGEIKVGGGERAPGVGHIGGGWEDRVRTRRNKGGFVTGQLVGAVGNPHVITGASGEAIPPRRADKRGCGKGSPPHRDKLWQDAKEERQDGDKGEKLHAELERSCAPDIITARKTAGPQTNERGVESTKCRA